jgi:hypothetical protein
MEEERPTAGGLRWRLIRSSLYYSDLIAKSDHYRHTNQIDAADDEGVGKESVPLTEVKVDISLLCWWGKARG